MGALLPRARAPCAQTMGEVDAMFPRLAERRGQAAGTMSGGEQQMLAIGRCLMGKPELIMFDEPSLGLAPALVQELFRTIRALNQRGLTVLLVEQNVVALAEAREPRLRAGERPHRHVRHRRRAAQRRPRAPGLSRDRCGGRRRRRGCRAKTLFDKAVADCLTMQLQLHVLFCRLLNILRHTAMKRFIVCLIGMVRAHDSARGA